MIQTDNTNIKIKSEWVDEAGSLRQCHTYLKEIKEWLKERNIKYSFVYLPQHYTNYPYAINMRNEDALAFKLAFGL